jgi:hypothetical protein
MNLVTVDKAMRQLGLNETVREIVTPGHFGVSMVLQNYALQNNLNLTRFQPPLKSGKLDYVESDNTMLAYADTAIILDDPDCRRTQYLAELAESKDLAIHHVKVDVIDRFNEHKRFLFVGPTPMPKSDDGIVYQEPDDDDDGDEAGSSLSEWLEDDILETEKEYYDDEDYMSEQSDC